MRRLLVLASVLSLISLAQAQTQAAKMTHRWFYLQTNLLTDTSVTQAQNLLTRAKAAGYNGMVITDAKFDIWGTLSPDIRPRYLQHVQSIKQTARELGIGVYPVVCTIGYEGGVLYRDPQLAEALPVKQAPFIAHGGTLAPVSEVAFQNGDFEQSHDNTFNGWKFQDSPGQITFSDSTEKHGGTASVRMQAFNKVNARIVQTLTTKPYQWLHLSVWAKTRDFDATGNARALALGEKGKVLNWVHWDIKPTQNWTRYDTTFNTGDNTKINIYLGVWDGHNGQIWWDDAKIESAGVCNLVRRPGAPFSMQSEDGTRYEEGRDFTPVRDDKTGNVPWPASYDEWHESPTIRLTPHSRIKDGQTVQVSYYTVQKAEDGSVAPCLCEPKTFDILRTQIREVVDLWQPQGLFLGPDEIRQLGSCEACQKSGKTAGQIMADAAKQCVAMARAANPNREVWIWSDMFDPNHNAHDDYYLVKGSLENSWQGLDKGVGIINWNFDNRQKSLAFFAERSHTQIISGFYDAGNDQIKNWMASAKNVPHIEGAMYTTWNNDYSQLENFAQSAWEGVN